MDIGFIPSEDSIAVYDKHTLSNIGHIVNKDDVVVFEQLGYYGSLSIETIEKIIAKMKELQVCVNEN